MKNTTNDQRGESFAASDGSAFRREYLGMPHQETADERKLRALAEEYHRRTEAYDRTICTGPIKRGGIMPANGWEMSQINRHAKAVRDELEVEAAKLGFSPQQWRDAIRRAANTPNPATHHAPGGAAHRERAATSAGVVPGGDCESMSDQLPPNDNIATPRLRTLKDYLHYQYPATRGDLLLSELCDRIAGIERDLSAVQADRDNILKFKRQLLDRPDLKDRAASIAKLTGRIAEAEVLVRALFEKSGTPESEAVVAGLLAWLGRTEPPANVVKVDFTPK